MKSQYDVTIVSLLVTNSMHSRYYVDEPSLIFQVEVIVKMMFGKRILSVVWTFVCVLITVSISLLNFLQDHYEKELRRYNQQLLMARARYEREHRLSLLYNKVISFSGLEYLKINLPEFIPPGHQSSLITIVHWCQSNGHPELIKFLNDGISGLPWKNRSSDKIDERWTLIVNMISETVLSILVSFVPPLISSALKQIFNWLLLRRQKTLQPIKYISFN